MTAAITLDNVPRIDPIADRDFLETYLRPARPVVIRNLYGDDPIARIRTVEDAVAQWGDIDVPVQLEYATRLLIRGEDKRTQTMPLRQFLALSPDDPDTRRLGVLEEPLLAELAEQLRPPSYAALGGAPAADMQYKMFVAHKGHWAHAHYDLDGRAVLLTQVFGRKRVWLVPPERGQLLDPMIRPAGHWSSLFIENLALEQKLDLARLLGAYDTVLEPGDTLLMPTAWWHYVDYLSTGMGFAVRLGRTPRQQNLFRVADALPTYHRHYWQGIAPAFATGAEPSPALCARADAVCAALDRAQVGTADDIAAFGQAVVQLYRDVCPNGHQEILVRNDLQRREPITQLVSPPEPTADREWSLDSIVMLSDGTEITEPLDKDSRRLVVLMGDQVWRIDADDNPETFHRLRALLTVMCANPDGVAVDALARQLAVPAGELIELLGDLAATGCVQRLDPLRAAPGRAPRWRPVLEDADTGAAQSVVAAIADRLAAYSSEELPTPSLAKGETAIALALSHLRTDGARETIDTCLDTATRWIATEQTPSSLYLGFPGIAWACRHVRGSEDDATADIDDALIDWLEAPTGRDIGFDLFRGLTGIGLYALGRADRAGVRIAELVVDRLDGGAVRFPAGGCAWGTPTAQVSNRYRLGLAEGVAGVVALLARLVSSNVAVAGATPLLDASASWLASQARRSDETRFPIATGDDDIDPERSLSWCAGDPGIAVALLAAGEALGRGDLRDLGMATALSAAARSEATRLRDANLCHGTAGLAHVFGRLFASTGADEFATASRRWVARTLELRGDPDWGLCGYAAWRTPVQGRAVSPIEDGNAWMADAGLLTGVAGIALALDAACGDDEPSWDRLLLLS